jgi:hypothetical protein
VGSFTKRRDAAGAATPGSYNSYIGKYATGDATGSSAAHGSTSAPALSGYAHYFSFFSLLQLRLMIQLK